MHGSRVAAGLTPALSIPVDLCLVHPGAAALLREDFPLPAGTFPITFLLRLAPRITARPGKSGVLMEAVKPLPACLAWPRGAGAAGLCYSVRPGLRWGRRPLDLAEVLSFLEHGRALARRREPSLPMKKRKG